MTHCVNVFRLIKLLLHVFMTSLLISWFIDKCLVAVCVFVSFRCSMKADLCHMNFQYLDFGEIDALDKFHNADVAVVDMSIHVQQATLFYHIGMRESMGMPETIILLNDTDPEFTLSVKVSSIYVCFT